MITFHAYNHSPFSRPLPYPSTFSSYNNPSFAVPPPPQPPQAFYNTTRLPNTTLLNQPPPIPNQGQPPFANQQPVHAHYAPPHTFIPASQPVAYHQPVPVSSPSPSLSLPLPIGVSKTLPTVTHIPILTSKHDFFPWDEGVQALIRANGLIGHILDPMASVNPSRPDLAPTPPPILSMSS